MTGANRKNQLKALFGTVGTGPDQDAAPAASQTPSAAPAPVELAQAQGVAKPRNASGAVKAMGLTLGGLSREVEEARRLKDMLGASDRVVEIEPGLIDTSFVSDRLGADDGEESFQSLLSSIETSGQQVPVLVRPHPETPGRYQTAYGHRRIRAAAKLGKHVRAIVRDLSDTELVLAQGKENTERRDLSFIERAFFAHALIARGFERAVVQEALSLHKAEMTRYLQVAEAVPAHVARAIGPAPKVGRPRWMALADLLKSEAARVKAQDEITSARFRAAGSDERFNLLFSRLNRKASGDSGAIEIRDEKGRAIAQMTASRGRARIEFVDKMGDGFAEFMQAELPKLLERFNGGGEGQP